MPYCAANTHPTFGVKKGDLIADRYKVVSEAGAGNFARVLKAEDTHQGNELVAVKILRKEFQKDAMFEKQILDAINTCDRNNEFKVCKMKAHFNWGAFPCFVFGLLGQSLKCCQFGFGRVSDRELANFTKQACRTLAFLHFTCKLIHTDLKPENVLLEKEVEKEVLSGGIGNGWSVCDLGSASFYSGKPDQDLIQTRPYRAPEVVLGCPWSYAVDMWSIGCILYELKTGHKMFDLSSDEQHLMMFEKKVGKIPPWLARNANPKARRSFFDFRDRLVHSRSVFTTPYSAAANSKHLSEEFADEPEFLDFLMQCFEYDPVSRMRADEAAHHPWVLSHFSTQAKLISKLPHSGYTSGAIRTPAAALLEGNMPLSVEQRSSLKASTGQRSSSPPVGLDRVDSEVMINREQQIQRHAVAALQPHLRPAAGVPSYGSRQSAYARGPLAMPPSRPTPPGPPDAYVTSSSAYGSSIRQPSGRAIPTPTPMLAYKSRGRVPTMTPPSY